MRFLYLIASTLKFYSFSAKFISLEISTNDFHSEFPCKHRDEYSTGYLGQLELFVGNIQKTTAILTYVLRNTRTTIHKTRKYSYHCDHGDFEVNYKRPIYTHYYKFCRKTFILFQFTRFTHS